MPLTSPDISAITSLQESQAKDEFTIPVETREIPQNGLCMVNSKNFEAMAKKRDDWFSQCYSLIKDMYDNHNGQTVTEDYSFEGLRLRILRDDGFIVMSLTDGKVDGTIISAPYIEKAEDGYYLYEDYYEVNYLARKANPNGKTVPLEKLCLAAVERIPKTVPRVCCWVDISNPSNRNATILERAYKIMGFHENDDEEAKAIWSKKGLLSMYAERWVLFRNLLNMVNIEGGDNNGKRNS